MVKFSVKGGDGCSKAFLNHENLWFSVRSSLIPLSCESPGLWSCSTFGSYESCTTHKPNQRLPLWGPLSLAKICSPPVTPYMHALFYHLKTSLFWLLFHQPLFCYFLWCSLYHWWHCPRMFSVCHISLDHLLYIVFPLKDITLSPVCKREKDKIIKLVVRDILAPSPLILTFIGSSSGWSGCH